MINYFVQPGRGAKKSTILQFHFRNLSAITTLLCMLCQWQEVLFFGYMREIVLE